MKVAIIGKGYAGLAVCWHLLQIPGLEVRIYDEERPSASKASTGLLYPFPGRSVARSWQANEGMKEALCLIEVAEQILGRPVANRGGILRYPWFAWQEKELFKFSKKEPEVIWQEGHVWIPSGMAVYSQLYMEGLWKACLGKGAQLKQERVATLSSLHEDQVVLATGAETNCFLDLPLVPVKGQALICRWGEEDRLTHSLVANGHITPTEDPDLCMIGSTYERSFTHSNPDSAVIPELLARAAKFYPAAKRLKVVDVVAGIRMTRLEGYRPFAEKVSPRLHVLTGLGSRGLLYHGLMGKQIAESIKLDL